MARGKGGGPHSLEGRQRSSRNSTKHGMFATKNIILPDERQEDFDRIAHGWTKEWEPEGFLEERLVEELIFNDWLLHRGRRRVNDAEAAAVGPGGLAPDEWTAEAKENVAYLSQLRAQAERAFYRSLAALNQLRRDILREKNYCLRLEDRIDKLKDKVEDQGEQIEDLNQELEKRPPLPEPEPTPAKSEKAEAKPLSQAKVLFQGQLNAKKKARRRPKVLEQWVHVSVKEGKTITALFPSNEDLIKRGQKFWPPPELVYRRLDFRNGVPKEYHWTTYDPVRRAAGGMGIQRMTTDQWLLCIEREKQNPDGHIGPTGVGNMARPHSRGGCNCESCTRPNNVKLMEEWEKRRTA